MPKTIMEPAQCCVLPERVKDPFAMSESFEKMDPTDHCPTEIICKDAASPYDPKVLQDNQLVFVSPNDIAA